MKKNSNNLNTKVSFKSVNPLAMRVLVRIEKNEDRSNGGLFLPEGSNDKLSESLIAKVVEVASAIDIDTSENENISGIPLGAYVLIEKHVGVKVPWDDNLRIVETADVLATVKEIGYS